MIWYVVCSVQLTSHARVLRTVCVCVGASPDVAALPRYDETPNNPTMDYQRYHENNLSLATLDTEEARAGALSKLRTTITVALERLEASVPPNDDSDKSDTLYTGSSGGLSWTPSSVSSPTL